jgi:hypothetical protein
MNVKAVQFAVGALMKLTTVALFLIGSLPTFAGDKSPSPAAKGQLVPSKTQAQVVSKAHEDPESSGVASDDDFCYTMRVYMFQGKDGEAPRPKGVATCVASNPRIMKKTAEPQAQFKPLK